MSTWETITLSRHNNSLFEMFRCNTRFLDLVQCIINYAVTLELKNYVQFLQTPTFYTARIIPLSRFIQDVSLSTCRLYIREAKLFLKNNNDFTFVN